jgi:hypothetical protein
MFMDRFRSAALLALVIVWYGPAKAEGPSDVSAIAPNPTGEVNAYAGSVPFKTRFAGAYAAGTGGYDFSTMDQGASYPIPFTSFDAIKGGKIGGVLGYNATSDRLLLGFETRAQYAFGADSNGYSYSYTYSLPFDIGSCWGCGPGAYRPGPTPLVSAETYSERVSRPFSGDLSLRAGLIFGRAGAGAEYSKKVTSSDQTGSATCVSPIVASVPIAGGGYNYQITGCGSIEHGVVTVVTTTKLAPMVTLASGIERNFGLFFARAEAELIVHFPAFTSQAYYSPAVNLALGYRF